MLTEKKVLTVIVDLRCRIYALKCMDEVNVRNYIHSLSMIYEQLKGMGETITNGDFTTLILGSLLKTYCSLINTISLKNHTSTTPPKPKIIIELILEEFNQLQIGESQSKAAENVMMVKSGKGKAKKKKNPSGSSGSLGTTTNPDVQCWNYGEKGHIRTKCPKTAKRK